MGHLFYLMGKSASGKDTIYQQLRKKLDFATIVLYTTRPMRDGEREGVEYHFVTPDRFEQLVREEKVIESRTYQTMHGPWTYFTADDGQVQLSRKDYLVIGTLESFEAMRAYYGADRVVPLYLELEDGIRLARALSRERLQEKPKYAELCRRYLADEQDFSEEKLRQAGIERRFCTEDTGRCVQELLEYIGQQG